jgi:hypothetical protein
MLPSLSDRTISFIAVSAVLAIAVGNVVFGMNWLVERPTARPLAAVTGVTEPPMAASPPVQAARPALPAAAGSPPMKGNTAAQTNAPAAPAAADAPQPLCDVTACAAAYRTFRASDCTYMPSFGERRLCTKGTPPQ